MTTCWEARQVYGQNEMSGLSLSQKIDNGYLSVQDTLGSGAFGTVYKVYDNINRNTYALKKVICINQSSIDAVKREANTMIIARHERIVAIMAYDFTRDPSTGVISFLLLTEFCSGGDLNSRLDSVSTRATNLKWICQISEALSYLHSLNPPIVHRDLKADNVLLTDPSTQNLKIGDFGLAREYLAMKNISSFQSVQTYYLTSGVGPIHWMAPEFYNQHYTEKADVFSLAGIFYAILTREYIQIGSKKMYGVYLTYQLHGKVGLGYAMAQIDPRAAVIFPSSFQGSNAMMRLIRSMLSYNRHNRPTASEVNDTAKNIRDSERLAVVTPRQSSTCC